MMTANTITAALDGIESWVRDEVAPALEFLVPGPDARVYDIEPTTGRPTVYQAFIPGESRLAEEERQAPSITVQLLDGRDSATGLRSIGVRLALYVWAPGHFDGEGFHRNKDGWRDLYNGLDAIASAVAVAETIGGLAVDQQAGVRFGFVDFNGEIPDLYPFWLGKVDFDLVGGVPANKRFLDYL